MSSIKALPARCVAGKMLRTATLQHRATAEATPAAMPTPAPDHARGRSTRTYCVTIKWNRTTEDWCRYVFKAGDKYYAFDTLEDTPQGERARDF